MKYLLLIVIAVLFSCKTPQNISSAEKTQEQKSMAENALTKTESVIDATSLRELQRLTDEQYSVKIILVKYDTDKPVDSLTRKPPVGKEVHIDIEKNTIKNETENNFHETIRENHSETEYNAELNSVTKKESTGKSKIGLNTIQKRLIAFSIVVIIIIVIFVIIKIKNIWK